MKFFTIVAFLAVSTAVALDCDVATTETGDCIDAEPCAADNPCASTADRPCCADSMTGGNKVLYCCTDAGSVNGFLSDDGGTEEAPDEAPVDDTEGGDTGSAAPKESAITAAIGVALVGGAALLQLQSKDKGRGDITCIEDANHWGQVLVGIVELHLLGYTILLT